MSGVWPLALLLLASPSTLDDCPRWVGGVASGDDYVAAVVRIQTEAGGRLSGSAAFPNQRRAVRFSAVTGGANGLRMEALPDERWSGTVDGDTFAGTWSRGEESGRFQLVCAPDVPAAQLRAHDGMYRFDDDGSVVRLAVLSRITDDLLLYFDPAANEERWLFPTSPTTFVAGPTFERPFPVERRFELTADGFRVSAGSRTRTARRVPQRVEIPAPMIEEFLRTRDVPGVTVGVVTRDGLLWSRGFGFADRERRVEATAETPYQIGSVTKVFTATLLMALAESGVVGLDDRVFRWLPEVTLEKPVTLRDLVTHVSGLPPDPINRVDREGVMQPYEVADLVAGLRGTILQSEPGTRWSYSNLGYGLLGHVLERATGRTYETLLREQLTGPLGMASTAIAPKPDVEARLAVHYWPEDEPRRPRPRWRFGSVAAFGGVTSTVPDLARFVQLHLRAGETDSLPVSGVALARMQPPQRVLGPWDRAMAIGWMIRRDRDGTLAVHHGGEVDGHSSFVALSPGNGIGVIVLANLGGPTADDLGWLLFANALEQVRRDRVAPRSEAFGAFFRGEWSDAAAGLEKIVKGAPADTVARSRYDAAVAAKVK